MKKSRLTLDWDAYEYAEVNLNDHDDPVSFFRKIVSGEVEVMSLDQIIERYTDLQLQEQRLHYLCKSESGTSEEVLKKIEGKTELLWNVQSAWGSIHGCLDLAIYNPKENGKVKIVRGAEALRLYDLISREDNRERNFKQGPTVMANLGCVLLPNAKGLNPVIESYITPEIIGEMDEQYDRFEGEEVSFNQVISENRFEINKVFGLFQKSLETRKKFASWFRYSSVMADYQKRYKGKSGLRGRPHMVEDPEMWWESMYDFYTDFGYNSDHPFALANKIDFIAGNIEDVKCPIVLFPIIGFGNNKATISFRDNQHCYNSYVVRSSRSNNEDVLGKNSSFQDFMRDSYGSKLSQPDIERINQAYDAFRKEKY